MLKRLKEINEEAEDRSCPTVGEGAKAEAALLILLDDSRQAACYRSTDAENTHKRYEDVSDLPDEFLLAKIRTLIRPALLQTDPEFFGRDLV